jgi:hypothetical protein
MTKYLQIEYLIAPDGKITERVINGSGNDCLETTSAIESELGQVEQRELLPSYYEDLLDNQIDIQASINL